MWRFRDLFMKMGTRLKCGTTRVSHSEEGQAEDDEDCEVAWVGSGAEDDLAPSPPELCVCAS